MKTTIQPLYANNTNLTKRTLSTANNLLSLYTSSPLSSFIEYSWFVGGSYEFWGIKRGVKLLADRG